ncbi:MAG: carbonic anhydrase [Devosia nanyangense]|uniref:Carbonic anhydrase n=1 Tax=Devosia nanyangense TaxID=1228055 RepID=A0A933L3E6_9HYPH|nr:carbonic anhydrase [Devosia nanyangense]
MHSFPKHLIDGYAAFMRGPYAEAEGKYKRLAKEGQAPTTMVIACCDSRAAPETIFDAGPGELFVLRNVGNLVPPFQPDGGQHGTSAGIEFAVNALDIENLVVLGHGRCGGIRAALNPGHALAQGDFISKWMNLLAPVTAEVTTYSFLTPTERETVLERLSVRNSIKNLRTFPYVHEREADGRLKVHGAWFDISTGELWLMDNETGDFARPEID